MWRGWVTFALAVTLTCGQAGSVQQRKGQADRSVSTPKPGFDAAAIENPNHPDTFPNSKGSAVVRAQILLERAHFSCGEIDGDFGTNLQKTVAAYRDERKLPASGAVDSAMWAALNADTAPPLMTYTITGEDERGPFVTFPDDMLEKSKLPALGYSSPLEAIAEHFHVSPQALKALNPGADFTRAGQILTVPNVLTMPPGDAAKVVVSKSESSVRAFDAAGKLLAFYVATIGSEHDPLPIGQWKIVSRIRNPIFHYDSKLFWDAAQPDVKADIQPGPNNPVGLVWMDLSKPHYGIHGTPEPSRIGHVTSHGCIRLTNWDALELAEMVKPGVTQAILKE